MRLFAEDDGIDEDGCILMFEGSYDFYIMVLQTFCTEIEKTVMSMKETYDAGDVENYRILVHGLKGSGASAGALKLVDLATRSNALIKEGNWPGSKELHEPIIAELERLIALIPVRLEGFKDKEEK